MQVSWVERIHTRLLARYGSAWVRMWDGVDADAIKADWCEELDGMSKDAVAYALAHLPPDRPPNSAQFKALAINRPAMAVAVLPPPKADPERVAKVVAGIARPTGSDPRAWARRLKARIDAGYKPTITQRNMVRDALENRCEVIEA